MCLVIQVLIDAPERDDDVDDIVRKLEVLLGPDIRVTVRLDRVHAVRLDPYDGVWWFFAQRAD